MKKGHRRHPFPVAHTLMRGWGGPCFRALPALLIPTFRDAPKAGTSASQPRVGAILPSASLERGERTFRAARATLRLKHKHGGGNKFPAHMAANQQAHWPTGLSVPTSLTHSGRTLADPRGPLVSRDVSRHDPDHTARDLEHERTVVILCGGYEPRSWVASQRSFPEGTRCSLRRPGFLKWKPSKRCSPRRPRHPVFFFPQSPFHPPIPPVSVLLSPAHPTPVFVRSEQSCSYHKCV